MVVIFFTITYQLNEKKRAAILEEAYTRFLCFICPVTHRTKIYCKDELESVRYQIQSMKKEPFLTTFIYCF